MEKRQLTIKDRRAVEDGQLLVVTRSELPVRVLCWDRKGTEMPIVALVLKPEDRSGAILSPEVLLFARGNGMECKYKQSDYDLFVVENEDYTPKEPEQSLAVDWDAFRRDAAKEFVGALIYSGRQCLEPREWFCEQAIGFADELIKQLKEGKK